MSLLYRRLCEIPIMWISPSMWGRKILMVFFCWLTCWIRDHGPCSPILWIHTSKHIHIKMFTFIFCTYFTGQKKKNDIHVHLRVNHDDFDLLAFSRASSIRSKLNQRFHCGHVDNCLKTFLTQCVVLSIYCKTCRSEYTQHTWNIIFMHAVQSSLKVKNRQYPVGLFITLWLSADLSPPM